MGEECGGCWTEIKKEEEKILRLLPSSPLSSAVWTGLEPATPCVTGRYSNQLNYHTSFESCKWCYFRFAMQRYDDFLDCANF